jgi:hypothetical protein
MTSAAPIAPATPSTQAAPSYHDHPDQPRFGRTFEDLAAQRPHRVDAGMEP